MTFCVECCKYEQTLGWSVRILHVGADVTVGCLFSVFFKDSTQKVTGSRGWLLVAESHYSSLILD
jgi:hypothetical protein